MTDKEIIARQAAEIIELRDKLAEAETVRNYWFNESQSSIRVRPMTSIEEHNLILNLMKMGMKI